MIKNFLFIFQYLKNENISIDQNEFVFQVQSHPDYPSLLAVSDTLSFFNIQNGVIRVSFSELALLPDCFVLLLKEKESSSQLYYIEKKGEDYLYLNNSKFESISIASLESRWDNVVLLVEKSETEKESFRKKNKLFWVLPLLCFSLFIITIFQFNETVATKLFFMFPILGFLFSIAALKDLFGTKSELLNNFCNITTNTSCSTIIDSEKWSVFKLIKFSDLSILLFTSQFFALLLFIFSGNSGDFFSIQKLLLLSTTPVIFLSLYYQKFVEEKWCPICLVIISVITFELIYIFFIQNINFNISTTSLIIFGLVYVFATLIWFILKDILIQLKELKEFQFTGNRFMRNYEIFKSVLLSEEKKELAFTPIILGNKESNTEIAIITSPFCSYCKDAHEIIEKILVSNRKNLKIKILINTDIDSQTEEEKMFFRSLISIYIEKGEEFFIEALSYWFKIKSLKDWGSIYNSTFDSEKIDPIYKLQNQWCIKENSFQTPSIFINGYRYPKSYDRKNLSFFINELVEDNNF